MEVVFELIVEFLFNKRNTVDGSKSSSKRLAVIIIGAFLMFIAVVMIFLVSFLTRLMFGIFS